MKEVLFCNSPARETWAPWVSTRGKKTTQSNLIKSLSNLSNKMAAFSYLTHYFSGVGREGIITPILKKMRNLRLKSLAKSASGTQVWFVLSLLYPHCPLWNFLMNGLKINRFCKSSGFGPRIFRFSFLSCLSPTFLSLGRCGSNLLPQERSLQTMKKSLERKVSEPLAVAQGGKSRMKNQKEGGPSTRDQGIERERSTWWPRPRVRIRAKCEWSKSGFNTKSSYASTVSTVFHKPVPWSLPSHET